MKRLLLPLLLLATMNASAASPDWKSVDEALRKGLPKTAIERIEPILQQALADKNNDEAVRAITRKIELEAQIEGARPEEKILRIEPAIEQAPAELKPVLQTLRALWFWEYYQRNRYRFMGRTATSESPGADFKSWDLPRLLSEIDKAFSAVIGQEETLAKIPVANFKEFLEPGTMPDRYRPTLFDVVAHEAIAFYSLEEHGQAQPENAFILEAESPVFDTPDKFLAWHPGEPGQDAPQLKAIGLFQKLLRRHADDTDLSAYADADLARITWAATAATGEKAQERHREALNRFIKKWETDEISALALHHLGTTLLPENPLAAHETAAKGAKAFPKSIGGGMCRELMAQIEQPSLQVFAERVWNKAGPECEVAAKNLTEVHFRLVPWNWNSVASNSNRMPDQPDYQQRNRIITEKPERAWKIGVPQKGDYKLQKIKAGVPTDVPPGFYYLVASARPEFSEKDNQISATGVWVSDLALVIRPHETRVEGFVLNAETGEPVSGASVESWYDNDQRKRISGPEATTDAEGFFSLQPPKQYRELLIKASAQVGNAKHEISTTREMGPQWWERPTERPDSSTFFFTDRAIYRPGQTVHYKGICVRSDQSRDQYKTLANNKVTAVFRDANGKEIARANHTTNERGSFSGEFTAPRDRLMGQMQISTEGGPNGGVAVRVEEYKRPKFRVTLDAPKEAPRLGETVKIQGKAEAFTGAPVDGAKVAWRVRRNVRWPIWCCFFFPPSNRGAQEIAHGTATTKTDGTFEISFTAKPDPKASEKDEPTFRFETHADVTDSAGETRSEDRAVNAGFTALRANITAPDWQETGRTVEMKITTDSLDDEPQNAKGTLRIHRLKQPEKTHRAPLGQHMPYRGMSAEESDGDEPGEPAEKNLSDPNQWDLGKAVKEMEFETKEGKATLKCALPPGAYRAVLETRDRFGKKVTARLPIQVLDPKKDQLGIKIPHLVASPAWQLEPGTEFTALWGTGYDAGRAFIEIEHRGKIVKRFWTDSGKTQQAIRIPVTEPMRGGFTLRVTQVRENRAYTQTRLVEVPWSNKELHLKWERMVSKLQPGQKETWTAVITGPNAEGAAAEMVATLYDSSLDLFLKHGWIDRFPIFRHENPGEPAIFQNGLNPLNQLAGSFRSWKNEPDATYRRFPQGIGRGYGPMSGSGMGRGGGGFLGKHRNGFAHAGAANGAFAEADGAVMAMSAPAPMAATVMEAPMDKNLAFFDLAKDAAGGEGKAAPNSPQAPAVDLSAVTARKNLAETAFFLPTLTSDKAGKVSVQFTMPEALTSWRFLGFAHDSSCRAGLLTGNAVTSKDLMLQPNPPRFLREGDVIEFSVKITNRADHSQKGAAKLTLADAQSAASADAALGNTTPEQPFDIPAGESRSLSWKLTVPDGCGFLSYKAVAATDALSDGEEGWLPVLPRRILVTESLPLPIRGPATKEFRFEKLLASGNSTTLRNQALVVQMTSNPAWYAVMALPYLMEFPHECSEQTFNRLYANGLARHIANSNPKIREVFDQWRNTPALDSPLEKNQDLKGILLEETPWYQDGKKESQARRDVGILFEANRLDAEAENALRKLREAQLPDGAWPWFPGGRGSDFITLYIVTGFGRLQHLGVDVPKDLAIRALGRIDRWIAERFEELKRSPHWKEHVPDSTEAFYLYGRSFFLKDQPVQGKAREAVDFYLGQARKFWVEVGCRQSQAHLALALLRFGDRETPEAIMKSLKERSVRNEEMGMFWKDTDPSWWWYRAPIETQALLIEAFDEITHDKDAVEECRVWLLKQKQTQNWKTTKATADAIYSLLLRGTDILSRDDLVMIELGGVNITPEKGAPGAKIEAGTGAYEKRYAPGEIKPEMGAIKVAKKDEGVAWGGVHWQYLEDMSKVTPHEGTPLKLKKQVFKRVTGASGQKLEPLKGPLAPGDEIVVRIELRVDRAMEYIHLKDQRGSGTEPVNVLSGARYQDGLRYYESTRDTASHFFIEYLNEGTYVFEYPLRIQQRGSYQTGIAEVQCMYAPEFNSHSESFVLEAR